MFFPLSGGLDLRGARRSHEDGCIELETDASTVVIAKPASLQLERFDDDLTGDWTDLRLNLTPLAPTEFHQHRSRVDSEEVAELEPGVYDKRSRLADNDCPADVRAITRLLRGALVLFARARSTTRYPRPTTVGTPWASSRSSDRRRRRRCSAPSSKRPSSRSTGLDAPLRRLRISDRRRARPRHRLASGGSHAAARMSKRAPPSFAPATSLSASRGLASSAASPPGPELPSRFPSARHRVRCVTSRPAAARGMKGALFSRRGTI